MRFARFVLVVVVPVVAALSVYEAAVWAGAIPAGAFGMAVVSYGIFAPVAVALSDRSQAGRRSGVA